MSHIFNQINFLTNHQFSDVAVDVLISISWPLCHLHFNVFNFSNSSQLAPSILLTFQIYAKEVQKVVNHEISRCFKTRGIIETSTNKLLQTKYDLLSITKSKIEQHCTFCLLGARYPYN